MAEFLGVVKLGTFYHNSLALSLPIRPWWSGSYPGSLSGSGNGDTPKFSGSISDWIIGDTNSNENKKLKWIKIKDINKTLLICDRVILNAISWNTLNEAGYITGKKIRIDGREYLCRVLTGGDGYRSGSDNYSGGQPTNEWDRFVVNEDSISGLPKPTIEDLDSELNYDDIYRTHNKLWNWWGDYSWCKEIYKIDSSCRVSRGFSSARYFQHHTSRGIEPLNGWRPVLEALNTPPSISGSDIDLGNKTESFTISYSVNDADTSDTLTIKEKLDNTIINTINNATRNQEYKIDLNSKFDDLSLGKHTIQIEISDGQTTVTRTYTFTKVNEAPKISEVDEDLGIKFKPFIKEYTISDIEKDLLKVDIKIDDNIVKTLENQTDGTIVKLDLNEYWTSLNLGEHIIKIEVSDKYHTTIRTVKFIKKDDKIIFNTKTVETSREVRKISLTSILSKEESDILAVYCCNNGFDEVPIWEDCTEEYINKLPYFFKNKQKTAEKWGLSIKFDLRKQGEEIAKN